MNPRSFRIALASASAGCLALWLVLAVTPQAGAQPVHTGQKPAASRPTAHPSPPPIAASRPARAKKPPIVGRRKPAGIPKPTVQLKPGEVPAIELIDPVYEFGRVRSGEKITHTFTFKNTGTGPLEILKVKPG